jgi:hypothetical protein
MSSIEKSSLVVQQEQRIESLAKEIAKVKQVIKSLKTRLSKTQAHFEETQREIHNKSMSAMEAFAKKSAAVKDSLKKILKKKKLPFIYREMLTILLQELEGQLDMERIAAQFKVPEEFKDEKAEKRDIFEDFRVEPKKEEKKNIRQLYVELSKQFHPDKASSKKEVAVFKEIQQQIVQAYQANDIHALEELKMWHGLVDDSIPDADTDALQQKIDQQERQLADLVAQKERISQELKNFRKSDMGKMLTDFDTMKRGGRSPLDEIDKLSYILNDFDRMTEILKEVDKTNSFDLLAGLIPELEEEEAFEFDLMSAFSDMMMDDDPFDEDDDSFGDIEENINSKFAVGSWVNIHWDKEHLKNYFELYRLNGKAFSSLTGKVISSVFHPFTGEPLYIVYLDAASLESLPKSALLVAIDRPGFGTLTINEEDLSKAKTPAAAILKKQTKEYNRIWMHYSFGQEPKYVKQYIAKMIASDTDEPQNRVVDRFIKTQLAHYPTIETVDYFHSGNQRKPVVVKLLYQGFNPMEGFIVIIKAGRRTVEIPLGLLEVDPKKYPELDVLIEAFSIWEDAYLRSYVILE